jgi:hypothetical protein
MPWLLSCVVLLGMLLPCPARGDDQKIEQTTKVAGTVPDLVGRWLVVSRVEVAPGAALVTTVTALWDVTSADGKPVVTLRQVDLPPSLHDSLEKASAAHAAWEPSARELADLGAAWGSLPVAERGVARIETKLTGSDAFDDSIKGEERTKGARFVVQQVVDFSPGAGRPIKDVYIYGALEQRPDGWSGNYLSASVAPTPVPIPITLSGTFRAYRVEAVAAHGLLARLMDVFAGCGRH